MGDMITRARGNLAHRLAIEARRLAASDGLEIDDGARHLVDLAAANRTAVHRALAWLHEAQPMTPTNRRALELLRLALARGDWRW